MDVRTLGPLDTMDRVKVEGRPVPVPVTKVGTGKKQGGSTGPTWRWDWALGPAPKVSHRTQPTLRAEHTGERQPVGTGTKPRGEQRTHHSQGGAESKEAGGRTLSKGTGGQGAARSGMDPDVRDTRAEKHRERTRATSTSYSAPGSCKIQHVTQTLRPWPTASEALASCRDVAAATNEPTNQPPL